MVREWWRGRSPTQHACKTRFGNIQMIHLAIRGFANGQRLFEQLLTLEEEQIDGLIEAAARDHAEKMKRHELHMIEIEFLDEPDPLQRFFRFGTDPRGMVVPIQIIIEGGQC